MARRIKPKKRKKPRTRVNRMSLEVVQRILKRRIEKMKEARIKRIKKIKDKKKQAEEFKKLFEEKT